MCNIGNICDLINFLCNVFYTQGCNRQWFGEIRSDCHIFSFFIIYVFITYICFCKHWYSQVCYKNCYFFPLLLYVPLISRLLYVKFIIYEVPEKNFNNFWNFYTHTPKKIPHPFFVMWVVKCEKLGKMQIQLILYIFCMSFLPSFTCPKMFPLL